MFQKVRQFQTPREYSDETQRLDLRRLVTMKPSYESVDAIPETRTYTPYPSQTPKAATPSSPETKK